MDEVRQENEFANMLIESLKKGLPQAIYEDEDSFDSYILTSDRIKLKVSVFSPDMKKKWPVILIRNPYQSNEFFILSALSKIFSSCGYALVYVRVRGTLGSEGEWLPFENERNDGRDVIDWIAEQEWCDGNIGTFGASYLGHTQWCIADYDHPMLKTMFISVYGTNGYESFYRRGMFRQEIWTEWAAQMIYTNKDKLLMPEVAVPIRKAAFSVYPQNQLGEQMEKKHCDWYETWLKNQKATDSYWADGFWKELRQTAPKVKIPVFLHGGWFDIFLRSQLTAWRELPEKIRKQSRFMIGPWHHSGLPGGDLEYPGEEKSGLNGLFSAIRWFDYRLKQKEFTEQIGVIEAYQIGENKWHIFQDDIQCDENLVLYFVQGTKADDGNIEVRNYCLIENMSESGKITYTYDPNYPVESCGGTLIANHHDDFANPECSCFQPKAQSRADVISFFSEQTEDEFSISGNIIAKLFVSSDVAATSFAIKVMEQFHDGRTVNIRDDITDIRWRTEEQYEEYIPDKCVELEMKLLDIDWEISKGSRIRVDIASSNYPAYHVHPNSLAPWYEEHENKIAHQSIYYGEKYPSQIIIPIRKGEKNA